MTQKSIFLSAILLFIGVLSLPAQIKLSGTVVDADTKEALEFAGIVLLKSDSVFVAGASSDNKGAFVFENLPQGNYILSSTFVGYHKIYTNINNLDKDRDLPAIALPASGIALKEVTVTGASIIQKADRKLLIPSAAQLRASNSGLTLLRNMQLSRVIVNPINNGVTTPSGEAVQLRINGIPVRTAEVVALQPQDIIRIEYHEDAGARYGNAAAVIDYITRRRESGGSISTNLSNALWRLGYAEDYLSAKVNHKKSEFSAITDYHYRSVEWTRENHETFIFPDDTLRRDEIGVPTKFIDESLNLSLNYNLNEPNKYLFNARFRNNYNSMPAAGRLGTMYSSHDPIPSFISDESSSRSNSPSLDLYFQRNLKNNQLLIFNAVGTYINSKSTRTYQRKQENKDPYISYSNITGDKYSLIAEGIYEKKLPSGTLTGGLRHTQSYTENVYEGSISSLASLTSAITYGHAEYQLRKKKFNYIFGLGGYRTLNIQDDNKVEKYIFRPSLRVVYNINSNAYIRYNGVVSGYAPSLTYLNNVEQNMDDLQVLRGNPNLKTVYFVDNTLNAGYNKGIFGAEFYANYRHDSKLIMEQIFFEDGRFIHFNANQRGLHRFHSEIAMSLRPWKNYISLNVTPGFNRYVSLGNDYQHTHNNWQLRGSLMAMYKNWMFYAEGNTRRNRFGGETLELGERMITLIAGYNTQKWSASVVMLNPFMDYSIATKNYSALAPYSLDTYSNNLNNVLVFNFSLNLDFGRKYNAADKRLDNTDTDAGIMKGEKK